MRLIQDPDAVIAPPAMPALTGNVGYFYNGNPATGEPATVVPDWWLNMIQVELAALLTAAGLPLDGSKTVLQAIAALISPGSSLGQNGYKILPDPNSPSGQFIMQWGLASTANGVFVPFPIAFPTACASVVLSESNATASTWGSNNPTVHGVGSLALTGFEHYTLAWGGSSWSGAAENGCFFMAKGY